MDIKLLFKNKIGLALAGGGAKGAYQVGVFQAIHELELQKFVKVVSGTSIGALNGALFLLEDPALWKEVWEDARFSNFLSSEDKDKKKEGIRSFKDLQYLFKESWSRAEEDWENSAGISDFLLKQNLNLFSQKGLTEVINKHVNLKDVIKDKRNLYACAYNIDLLEPEYFLLNNLDKKNAQSVLLASACIPFMYEPVSIGQYRYMDGGINNPLYKKENTDKIPVKPLFDEECDIIITVFLSHEDSIDYSIFPSWKKKVILEIYPTLPLEDFKGAGTFDFFRSSLDERIELGYHDAMFILAPMIVKLLQGKSIKEVISHHNEFNRKLRDKFVKLRTK